MKKLLIMIVLIITLTLYSCPLSEKPDLNSEFKTANSLYIKGKTTEALSILEVIEKKDPSFSPGLFLSGKIHFIDNRPKKAEEKWRKAVSGTPIHIQSGKWLCRKYIAEKRNMEAEKLLFRLFRASDADPEFLIIAGKLRKNEGRYLEAIEYYKKAFLFEDKLIEAHLDIAEIFCLFGIRDKSLIHLKKAASIGGEDHELFSPVESIIKTIVQQ